MDGFIKGGEFRGSGFASMSMHVVGLVVARKLTLSLATLPFRVVYVFDLLNILELLFHTPVLDDLGSLGI